MNHNDWRKLDLDMTLEQQRKAVHLLRRVVHGRESRKDIMTDTHRLLVELGVFERREHPDRWVK